MWTLELPLTLNNHLTDIWRHCLALLSSRIVHLLSEQHQSAHRVTYLALDLVLGEANAWVHDIVPPSITFLS